MKEKACQSGRVKRRGDGKSRTGTTDRKEGVIREEGSKRQGEMQDII